MSQFPIDLWAIDFSTQRRSCRMAKVSKYGILFYSGEAGYLITGPRSS